MSFSQPATVEDLLNYRLSTLLAASGAMVTRLCEGRYGITRREWRLICLLAVHGPMAPSDLATRAHLERSRVSRHITDLVGKTFLARVRVPEDGRRALVALTASGNQLYRELFPRSVRLNNMLLQALEPGEMAIVDRVLSRLTEHAEQLAHSDLLQEKADRRHGGSRRFAARRDD